MQEFRQRSKKYVNLEDTTLNTMEPIKVPTVHVEQQKRQPQQQQLRLNEPWEKGEPSRRGPRGRFNTYAPLATTPARIY